MAKCLDISESGLRIEVSVNVPPRTAILINAERIKLSGPASVKHVVRHGAKYILGVELSQALHDKAVAALREPWGLRAETRLA